MATDLIETKQYDDHAFMPAVALSCARDRYNALLEFTQEIMKSGKDYGIVPGTVKPTLLKPGAEKLCSFFGLTVEDPEILTEIEDWDKPFFFYKIRQRLTRNGKLVASQIGSCNSHETKYRFRWVSADQVPEGLSKAKLTTRGGAIVEFAFAVDKAETSGQYGKPAEYWREFHDAINAGTAKSIDRKTRAGKKMDAWEIGSPMYRVPNLDIADQVNTIQKMAQKRALIAAVLIACNASEYYTQDLEDMEVIDIPFHSITPPEAEKSADPSSQQQPPPAGGGKVAPPNSGIYSQALQAVEAADTPEATLKVCPRIRDSKNLKPPQIKYLLGVAAEKLQAQANAEIGRIASAIGAEAQAAWWGECWPLEEKIRAQVVEGFNAVKESFESTE